MSDPRPDGELRAAERLVQANRPPMYPRPRGEDVELVARGVLSLLDRLAAAEAENARLRAALEQYARPDYYYFLLDPVGRQTDPTKKAREALNPEAT